VKRYFGSSGLPAPSASYSALRGGTLPPAHPVFFGPGVDDAPPITNDTASDDSSDKPPANDKEVWFDCAETRI
jgi:hypothetical protein